MQPTLKTKHLAIYEELKKNIIEGKLKPGAKIKLSGVAKHFDVSEIPVREAIRGLESDGLVEFTPYVGAVVSKMNEKDFLEAYLIRIELEGLATRLGAEYLTFKDINLLEKINSEMGDAIEEGKLEKLGQLNKKFHLHIYNAAPFPLLNKMMLDLWDKVERIQSVFSYVPDRAKASVKEHAKIIDALKTNNSSLAEKLIRGQKSATLLALKKYLNENE